VGGRGRSIGNKPHEKIGVRKKVTRPASSGDRPEVGGSLGESQINGSIEVRTRSKPCRGGKGGMVLAWKLCTSGRGFFNWESLKRRRGGTPLSYVLKKLWEVIHYLGKRVILTITSQIGELKDVRTSKLLKERCDRGGRDHCA